MGKPSRRRRAYYEWPLLLCLSLVHVVVRGQPAYRPWRRGPDWAFAAAAGSAFALALSFVPGDYTPFIYFQF